MLSMVNLYVKNGKELLKQDALCPPPPRHKSICEVLTPSQNDC